MTMLVPRVINAVAYRTVSPTRIDHYHYFNDTRKLPCVKRCDRFIHLQILMFQQCHLHGYIDDILTQFAF